MASPDPNHPAYRLSNIVLGAASEIDHDLQVVVDFIILTCARVALPQEQRIADLEHSFALLETRLAHLDRRIDFCEAGSDDPRSKQ
jgi:hypothetical protein